MMDHLTALRERLAREFARAAAAKNPTEVEFRERQVASCRKEISAEMEFLGIAPLTPDEEAISIDELYDELS